MKILEYAKASDVSSLARDFVVEFVFLANSRRFALAASSEVYVTDPKSPNEKFVPKSPNEKFVPMSKQDLANYNLAIGKVLGAIESQGLTKIDNSRNPQHQSPESYSYYTTFKYLVDGDARTFRCEFRLSDHEDESIEPVVVTKTYERYTIIIDLDNVDAAISYAVELSNVFKSKVARTKEEENKYISLFEQVAKRLGADFQYDLQRSGLYLRLNVEGAWYTFDESRLHNISDVDELYDYVMDEIEG